MILELVNLGPLSRFDHVMGTRTYELYLMYNLLALQRLLALHVAFPLTFLVLSFTAAALAFARPKDPMVVSGLCGLCPLYLTWGRTVIPIDFIVRNSPLCAS